MVLLIGALGTVDAAQTKPTEKVPATTKADDAIHVCLAGLANPILYLCHRRVLAHDHGCRDAGITKSAQDSRDQSLLGDQRPSSHQGDAASLQTLELGGQRRDGSRPPVNDTRIRVREEPAHGVVILRTH